MRLDDFAREQMLARLGRLAEQIVEAHRELTPEAVHDVRVAIRRFSQVLKVFGDLLPAAAARSVKKKLRKLRDEAGDVRNLDVSLELIGARAPVELRRAFEAARWQAAAKLTHRLDRSIVRGWIARWGEELVIKDDPTPAAEFAAAFLAPLEEAFNKQGDRAVRPKTPPATRHKFRIAAKQLRYSLEIFAPLDPERLEARIEVIRRFQQVLGDANDCAVTLELVRRFGPVPTIERRLELRQQKLIADFEKQWKQLRGQRPAKPEKSSETARQAAGATQAENTKKIGSEKTAPLRKRARPVQ